MSGMSSPDNRFNGVYDANTLAVIICSALALYNALELELLVFTTFHAYQGLYFWSLVTASFGIIPYVLGFMMEYFRISYFALAIAIDIIGWSLMVTGQAVVLYSRLWLVFGGGYRRLLKAVKWMIVVNGAVLHGLTTGMFTRLACKSDADPIDAKSLYTALTLAMRLENLAWPTIRSNEYKWWCFVCKSWL